MDAEDRQFLAKAAVLATGVIVLVVGGAAALGVAFRVFSAIAG